MNTLGDALPAEIDRVRSLIPEYESIGPAGGFALAMIKQDLAFAERTIYEGDTVGMIKAYEALKGYKS